MLFAWWHFNRKIPRKGNKIIMQIGAYILPFIIMGIVLYASLKGIPVFNEFLIGAKDGIKTALQILPALVAFSLCVGMFKSSGALDIISSALEPIANFFLIPTQVIPLALLRPISGSGAMVIFGDILSTYGADSFIGRVASVMQGSTETTFYTIAVYFGATNIKKLRHTLPSALIADIIGFMMSALTVRIFFLS